MNYTKDKNFERVQKELQEFDDTDEAKKQDAIQSQDEVAQFCSKVASDRERKTI